ncbi:MAG: polyprenyl synthetase family protein [Bernardetiaceae bacterium]|jgi:geranylgeranyl diphosphate synthase type II|nr:polyprenyl synthetase family protein [Bernardetiaceae bacterium]
MTFDFTHATQAIESRIAQLPLGTQPARLYEPIRYIMALGGKRMRPLLVLLGYHTLADDWETAVPYAVAVEMFHNFTLLHDDIMDQAPLRRGQPTVHEKWDTNTALLSGDVMLVRTYQEFLPLPAPVLGPVLEKFSRCAAEVCEGQQFDMDFEARPTVAEAEYIDMIRLKTAVLLGFSLELGALLAGATAAQATALSQFGVNVGIGFQLMDDLLDVYADQAKFGKQVGGDIIANKKTFLLLKALELAQGPAQTALQSWLAAPQFDKAEKVRAVTALYDQLGIRPLTEQKMESYFAQGFAALDQAGLAPTRTQALREFAQGLIQREH